MQWAAIFPAHLPVLLILMAQNVIHTGFTQNISLGPPCQLLCGAVPVHNLALKICDIYAIANGIENTLGRE